MTPFTLPGPITTDRLTLRLMRESDVDALVAYHGREDVCRYLLYDAQSRDQIVERVAKNAVATTLAADDDHWQLVVELPATDAEPAHVVGDIYFSLRSVANLTGAIGWVFNPLHHGRGYATEAASAMLDLVFGHVGLHRVIAELAPENAASIALCRRLGMRQEAHHRQDLMLRGKWEDTGIFAILADEWRSRPRTPRTP